MEIFPNVNDKKIKCERRYNDFQLLFNRLQRMYPYIIIPELEKNFLIKIIKIDEHFFIKRKNQLNIFLKYIHAHEEIKATKEFIKFIRDPNFDNNFFKDDESFYDSKEFPESMRNHDSITNKIVDFLKIPFAHNSEITHHENERVFLKKFEFYNNALNKFMELKKFVVKIFNFLTVLLFLTFI